MKDTIIAIAALVTVEQSMRLAHAVSAEHTTTQNTGIKQEEEMTEVSITLEFDEQEFQNSDDLAEAVYTYLRDLMDDGSLAFTVKTEGFDG